MRPRFVLHSNSISERGDGVALFELSAGLISAGVEVKVVYWANSDGNSALRVKEFQALGVSVETYESRNDLSEICRDFGCTHFLTFSDGTRAGSAYSRDDPSQFRIPGTFHIVWAVFRVWEPHGDLYLYVSRWNLRENIRRLLFHEIRRKVFGVRHLPRVSALEHFVEVNEGDGPTFRKSLGIPSGASVIGRIGGQDQFTDQAARAAVREVVGLDPEVYFVFVNTEEFFAHPRVIYVPELSRREVWNFYAACDVILNGRKMGESFGFGIAEALRLGLPVLAPARIRNWGMDRNHIVFLRGLGLLYRSQRHLTRLMVRQLKKPVSARRLSSRAIATHREVGIQRLFKLLKMNF